MKEYYTVSYAGGNDIHFLSLRAALAHYKKAIEHDHALSAKITKCFEFSELVRYITKHD